MQPPTQPRILFQPRLLVGTEQDGTTQISVNWEQQQRQPAGDRLLPRGEVQPPSQVLPMGEWGADPNWDHPSGWAAGDSKAGGAPSAAAAANPTAAAAAAASAAVAARAVPTAASSTGSVFGSQSFIVDDGLDQDGVAAA